MNPEHTGTVNEVRRTGVWRRLSGSPWFGLLLALAVLVVVQGFVVKVYQVPSGSMEPTLQVGDRMLVNRLAYLGDEPVAGDVVVFAEPDDWRTSGPVERGLVRTIIGWVGAIIGIGPSNTTALVKRVVASPGQTLRCCDDEGQSLIDDIVLPSPELEYDLPFEPGVLDCRTVPASPRCLLPYRVPPNMYLALGDHRSASGDSLAYCRGSFPNPLEGCVRLVPRESLIGEVFTVIFPPSRWGAQLELTDG